MTTKRRPRYSAWAIGLFCLAVWFVTLFAVLP